MKILKYFKEKINPVVKFGNTQDAQTSVIAKFYYRVKGYKEELFIVAIICFSGFLGFGLGRLSKIEERKTPITIEQQAPAQNVEEAVPLKNEEYFVASKNGKKYYFPWCTGVDRISKSNLVRFGTREDAEKAGYEKAANCPGL